MTYRAKVLIVSDSVAAGEAEDGTGEVLATALAHAGYEVIERRVLPGEPEQIAATLVEFCTGFSGLVLTAGGTGFSPRDLTPEATRAVLQREAPGFAEAIRQSSDLGPLTRGVAGVLGRSLIVNLPGSPAGALASFTAVSKTIPHALELLAGAHPHPQEPSS